MQELALLMQRVLQRTIEEMCITLSLIIVFRNSLSNFLSPQGWMDMFCILESYLKPSRDVVAIKTFDGSDLPKEAQRHSKQKLWKKKFSI